MRIFWSIGEFEVKSEVVEKERRKSESFEVAES
jgi:hypothetical protein